MIEFTTFTDQSIKIIDYRMPFVTRFDYIEKTSILAIL